MLRPQERNYVLEQAYVPEHVLPLMEGLSGGEAHLAGEFLFFTGSDWLIMVGFPLGETPKHELECKLKKAREEFAPARLWLVGPQLPDFLERSCMEVEKDQYFRLDLKTPDGQLWAPPGKLQRLVAKARERFSVDSSAEFHSFHAQLTESLMQRGKPGIRVRELYGRLPWYLEKTPSAVLLSAWDPLGRLAAYAVLELAAADFSVYVAGACSRDSWASHASDLLMWEMALISIRENKQFMHLGLGVNPGISRFKRKWGGPCLDGLQGLRLEQAPFQDPQISKKLWRLELKLWDLLTEERALAMAWHLDREGRSSYLVGSAHFFPYKFRRALRSLARGASCVIVEGPLESGELREVARRGMGGQEGEGLSRFLDELTLAKLARVVGNQRDGSKGLLPWDALSGLGTDKGLRLVLDGMQPWMAFFTLWVTLLETLGWIYHMDRDALTIGKKMGCRVVQLESMEEQLTALEQIPKERILSFLKEADQWKHYSRLYVKLYLRGDLEGLLGLSKGFPSRCEAVIDNRDRVLYQRMLPYLERGGAVVLAGAPHTRAMLGWLRKEGYEVRQVLIR